LILAMGYEGVLVHSVKDNQWHWVGVGIYTHASLTKIDQVLSLLSDELWLALILIFLGAATLARRPKLTRFNWLLLIAAWLLWVMTFVAAAPGSGGSTEGYAKIVAGILMIPTVLLTLVVCVISVRAAMAIHSKLLLGAVGLAALMALLFLLPFFIWTQNGIPFYSAASIYSLALVAATMIAGRRYLRRFIDQPSSNASAPSATAS
jgi:hypothetical protein